MDKSYKSRPIAKSTAAFTELPQMPGVNGEPQFKGRPSIHGMKQWLLRIGHTPTDIERLNIVHVAGTKGKGSTCAFTKSILRAYGQRTGYPEKIGLYTSPHLVRHEERIKINFKPLSQDAFAKYVWQVHDKLASSKPIADEGSPRYLQLLALVSFHAFIEEKVDVAVYETHHGGEFDATNVIERPVASVITSLGFDHVDQLGPSIENIAWHKAGILKKGTAGFSHAQEWPAAAKVLETRAREKSTTVKFIDQDPALPKNAIQLSPDVQRKNCSVALAAARHVVSQICRNDSSGILPADIQLGVERFTWPGRFQIISEPTAQGPNHWFLDSAHNDMSITKPAEWFIETSKVVDSKEVPHVLMFSQISDQRDELDVFRKLAVSLQGQGIKHVVLTSYEVGDNKSTSIQRRAGSAELAKSYSDIWTDLNASTDVQFQPTIIQAVGAVHDIARRHGGVKVLVTGSQHLVGGTLLLLKPESTGLSRAQYGQLTF